MRPVLLAVLALLLLAPAALAVRGPVHPDGRWLKDPDGRVVIVHGLQIADKTPPYVPPRAWLNDDDAELVRGLGFDAVRVAWMWAGMEPKRGRRSVAYRNAVVRMVRTFADRGLLVLLEAHQDVFSRKTRGVGFPDWAAYTAGRSVGKKRTGIDYNHPGIAAAFSALYRNRAGIASHFASAWEAIARAVRGEQDMLLGYDLMNEPWPANHAKRCATACADVERRIIAPLENRLARGIRRQDAHGIAWYEPQMQFDFGARSGMPRPPADIGPAGFAWHSYCRTPKPGPCAATVARNFAHARAAAAALGGPGLLGEFGDTQNRTSIERVLNRADREMSGWMFWSYKDWRDVPGGPGDGSLFDDDHDIFTLRGAMADVLSRAYPEAVAGTPESWSWSRTRRRFALAYRPDPSVLPPTSISVPTRRHFRRGYRVRVTGGHVVSGPGAQHLLVDANPGASEVRVTVTP